MNCGDLATLSDRMGHESVQPAAEADDTSARDVCALFKRDELKRKHDEFSAVATMAGEGRL